MTLATPTDEFAWTLPGAMVAPVLPAADTFCATPLLDLLRTAAARDPGAIALTGRNGGLSYGELLRLACNVAGVVAERVRPGEAVACILPRRPDSIAAILGCLIAGRPCLIIGSSDPRERQMSLLQDTAPTLLLTTQPSTFADGPPVLPLEVALSGTSQIWKPDGVWDPDAPFVIHSTSGSTGRPKGIVLSARSVLYRGLFCTETMGVTRESRKLQPDLPVASGGFAAMLGILARGGRLVVADLAGEGANAVLTLMEREAVSHASIPPAMLRMMLRLRRARSAFAAVRMLRIGSSSLTWSDLMEFRQVLPADCTILHSYASTEALNIAQWVVPLTAPANEVMVPAGVLQLLHEFALLGPDGRPVAPGEGGELVLRGRYVALGEWRDGRLVEGRMTPVVGRSGWRSFRTGDVMRVGDDGLVRVFGRADRQVKINGVLVQPAEIEMVLKAEPLVTDAAVVARATPAGATLHGFVAATGVDAPALTADLRRRLATSLPMAFRPASLIVLDALPMLPGGKIDLVALSRRAAV